jgi:hypothetical protein
LQGLTRGYVKVRRDGKLKPCVVFGQSFPSWLPVLHGLGFEAVIVLLRMDEHLAQVEAFVGNKYVIWCGSDWGAFGHTVPNFSGQECCGLVDSRLTGEAMSLFGLMSVQQVAGTKHARWGFTGWSSDQIDVPHSKVGGITFHHATLKGFHQSMDSLHVKKLPYVVGRDAIVRFSRRWKILSAFDERRAQELFFHSLA